MIPVTAQRSAIPLGPKENLPTESDQRRIKLKKATQAFEAIFVSQLLKSMRSVSFDQSKNKEQGFGKEIMMAMADESVATQLSKSGIFGIGEMLYSRLLKKLEATPEESQELKIGSGAGRLGRKIVSGGEGHMQCAPTTIPSETDNCEKQTVAVPTETIAIASIAPEHTDVEKSEESAFKPALSDHRVIRESVEPQIANRGDQDQKTTGALGRYLEYIASASIETGLSTDLLKAVIMRESGGKATAVSRKGAAGLMQLMPDTAISVGVNDRFDPEENIRGGARYLRSLVDRFGDLKTALAAYNAGPANVAKYGGIPPYRETENYVAEIMAELNVGKSVNK